MSRPPSDVSLRLSWIAKLLGSKNGFLSHADPALPAINASFASRTRTLALIIAVHPG
jgi:hypothetical protein